MAKIVSKKFLAPDIYSLDIQAPEVADKARAGEFIVFLTDERSERIPLTIADWNRKTGIVTVIVQAIGHSTKRLVEMPEGEKLFAFLGPLGNPTHIDKYPGALALVAGGVGIAEIFPVARAFKEKGNRVFTIIGARKKELLILKEKLSNYSDQLLIATEDGSEGIKGFVTDALKDLMKKASLSMVYAVGPVPMMQAVALITRPEKIKTMVSLNPIMVDATGMCGACRVNVAGEIKFACVDGPEFDAHQVDFPQLIRRLKTYEKHENVCKLSEKLQRKNSK